MQRIKIIEILKQRFRIRLHPIAAMDERIASNVVTGKKEDV
jgi:hypothetical protein